MTVLIVRQDALGGGVEGSRVHGVGLVAVELADRFGNTGKVPASSVYLVDGRASVGIHRQPFSPGFTWDGTASLPSPVGGRSHLFVPDY